jgi:hypothetical protein
MATGPGKYDHVATIARMLTGAQGVVLMILGGDNGSGFSVQLPATNEADSSRQLVAMLRGMADDIERETK